MAKKDEKYTNLDKHRSLKRSYFGERTNDKAGVRVAESEVVDGLKQINSKSKVKLGKNILAMSSPGIFGTNFAMGMARDYKEGELTEENIVAQSLIHLNPLADADDFTDDEVNQLRGGLVTQVREGTRELEKGLNVSGLDSQEIGKKLSALKDSGNIDDYIKYAQLYAEVQQKNNDIDVLGKAKSGEFAKISQELSPQSQEDLAWWKATKPEERRLIDGQKAFSINESQSLGSGLNQRSLAQGDVIPDLNEIDRSHLPKDIQTGADIHADIGRENIGKAKDPKNSNSKGIPKPEAKFNTSSDKYNNIGVEQFGDGKGNVLGLGAGLASSGAGIFLNQYWLAILGVVLFVGFLIWKYFDSQKPKKKKTKKRTYKKKSKPKVSKTPVFVTVTDLNSKVQSMTTPTPKPIKETPKIESTENQKPKEVKSDE